MRLACLLACTSGCSLSQEASGSPWVVDASRSVPPSGEQTGRSAGEGSDEVPPVAGNPGEEDPAVSEGDDEDAARDSSMVGSPSMGIDAGGIDAGPHDAATPIVRADAAAVDGGLCGGSTALGLCWYLAAPGASCNAQCTLHGGFDARSLAKVGLPSQGGSAQDCAVVLGALGLEGEVVPAARLDLNGLGCHRWDGNTIYWIDAPSLAFFGPGNSQAPAEIACACAR